MKPLSNLITFTNAAEEVTQSRFVKMYVENYSHEGSVCVITYQEYRESDGTWSREYAMIVRPTTMLDVYHYVGGVRQRLMRTVEGMNLPVVADEFTLMRFMCWDHNFISLKGVIEAGLVRRKAYEEAIRNNQPPAPHEFDLHPAIPDQLLLDYLTDLDSE